MRRAGAGRIPSEVVLVVTPVLGFLGAFGAWQAALVVGRRVCGMAYGVPERVSTNAAGFGWTVLGTVLMVVAGGLLAFGRGRGTRIAGFLALGVFVLGAAALPLLAAGSCEGVPPAGRFPDGR